MDMTQNITHFNVDTRDFSDRYGMSCFEIFIDYALLIISTILILIIDILVLLKRKSYVIKHRGYVLTIPASFASIFIIWNVLCNELIYDMKLHNVYIWINNLLIVLVIMSGCGRTIRLILLYNLNAFKSECILQLQNFNESNKPPKVEVNSYMKTVDKMVKKKTGKWILIIPVLISAIITSLCEIYKSVHNDDPRIIKLFEFAPIHIFLAIYNLFCIYSFYALRKVKDNETFGIKFEVFVTFATNFFVMISIIIINFFNNDTLFEITHSGSYLYIFQTISCHFISTTVPLFLSIREEKKFKKQSQILSSAEFSKLLYQKPVIEDLKVIAINDFCVENILFWETYIKIKELTYQCLTKTGMFDERKNTLKEENIKSINKSLNELYSNSKHEHKYIHKKEFKIEIPKQVKPKNSELEPDDPYYTYVVNSNKKKRLNSDYVYYTPKVSSPTNQTNKSFFTPEDYKYYDIDPNIPLDEQLLPYYISFYKAFIDPYGPVTVNISSDIATNIYKELYNNPTVGVFDNAKNDVITSMFLTLYPQYVNLHLSK